jgi:hypothetical protein
VSSPHAASRHAGAQRDARSNVKVSNGKERGRPFHDPSGEMSSVIEFEVLREVKSMVITAIFRLIAGSNSILA